MSAEGMIKTVIATEFLDAIRADYPNWPPILPQGAVAKWLDATACAIARPQGPMRETALGTLPVNVTTIDQLDACIVSQRAALDTMRQAVITARVEAQSAHLAVVYAEAAYEYRKVRAVAPLGVAECAVARKRYRKARKAFARDMEQR